MSIGDVVKLKNIIQNQQHWLASYRNMQGTIMDFQRKFEGSEPQTVRVFFKKANTYEDLASWRVTKA